MAYASIYGLVLMLVCLMTGIIKLEQVIRLTRTPKKREFVKKSATII